jgi:phage FluMu protein gp41
VLSEADHAVWWQRGDHGIHRAARAKLLPADFKEVGQKIVEFVLAADVPVGACVCEASVHRPAGSRVWQATFAGPEGGQIWKSTGLTNQQQALLVARRWATQARAQRERLARKARKPIVRAGQAGQGGGLTQKEVALVMKISTRAVRQIEKRAIRKLAQHAQLRQVWSEYLAGELKEHEVVLSPEEIEALFGLAYTAEERLVLRKVLTMVQPLS